MSRLRNWFLGVGTGVVGLFAAHTIQPTQVERGIPPQVQATPIPAPSPYLNDSGSPKIASGNISSTKPELLMIIKGFSMANKVNGSTCFKQGVVSASFTENNGFVGQKLWEKLSASTIVVNVVMFDGSNYQNYISKTIGYEDEPGTVYMNRYFVKTSYQVADNLEHEGEGHSQGFSHFQMCGRFPCMTSEPYGMNALFEKCAPTVGFNP